jgi:hypothetical protein
MVFYHPIMESSDEPLNNALSFRYFIVGFEQKAASLSDSNDFILSFLKIDLRALNLETLDLSGIDSRTVYRI